MEDKGREFADDRLEKLEEELQREYSQALSEIKEKQRVFMAEYQKELTRMNKRLAEEKITAKEYEKWQYEQVLTSNWYYEMIDTLADDLVNVDQRAAEMINGYIPEIYDESVSWAAYEVEDMAGKLLVQPETVRNAIEGNLIYGDLFAAVDAAKDRRWNKKHIASAITQGILQGESMDKIATRLENAVGMDYRQAIKVARTLVTGAENKGRTETYERYKNQGIDVRQMWVATLDNRTRHTHRKLDREVVDVGEEFSNGLMFPGDTHGEIAEYVNCRCTLVAVVDGLTYDDAKRASKLGGMSYGEWKETRSKKTAKVGDVE